MWIRSQKETKLIKTNNFRVIERSGGYYRFKYPYCIETIMENDSIYLGEYSTMKKALKVLDMIQKILNNEFLTLNVFQMPKDSEVNDCEENNEK